MFTGVGQQASQIVQPRKKLEICTKLSVKPVVKILLIIPATNERDECKTNTLGFYPNYYSPSPSGKAHILLVE